MSDKRPRNQRPRTRGGKNGLAELAIVQRQQQSVLALQEALQPEAEALRSSTRQQVVDHIRARANELAHARADGDVAPVVEAALDEIFGLGPLEPLLRDAAVRTIRLDGTHLYADGEPVAWGFRDDAHAASVIHRILVAVGESPDATAAGVTVRLIDGSTLRAHRAGSSLQVHITRP